MQPEELKNIRKMRGLTLDEVCQKLGRLVSKQALSKYERGKMHPSPQVLEALLRIYQISSASLQLSFPVKINGWNFRRGEILSAKEEAIKSEINRCLQRYLYLENQLGIIASFKHPFLRNVIPLLMIWNWRQKFCVRNGTWEPMPFLLFAG